ncbi:helix-turn-helix transcriptional regulator [Metabacillus arenae]|uniref:AraC family transcriptional regulator n=1 Tax=Metabacillus arenae TaxID=2771434 RepID=A0A926NM87_9BACI|nr:AraC family transcriptional regulator [Metabacillus arenae]MBD1380607.1 AraC family transcriptional regulator [Metabacillus arenae]
MGYISFNIPPFPAYIKAGEYVHKKGTRHFKRTFTVFDMLYVRSGELFMTENKVPYSVKAGQYIILVPGLEHYGHNESKENTETFWLHFSIQKDYQLVEEGNEHWGDVKIREGTFESPTVFQFKIPRFGEIKHVEFFEKLLENLVYISQQTPDAPLRQQMDFEELLLHIQKEALQIPSAAEKVVEATINYIRKNYQSDIKMEDLARELHFHQDYITRCMQKTIGMTPNSYLNKYRITQSKRLLVTTDYKMASISSEVGISDSTYFSKLFKRLEGISPLEYRKIVNRRNR